MHSIALWFFPLLVFLIIFFLLVVPKNRKLKNQYQKVRNVKRGDDVLMSCGIFGKVIKLPADDVAIIEISKGVEIKVKKIKIVEVLGEETEINKKISKKTRKKRK